MPPAPSSEPQPAKEFENFSLQELERLKDDPRRRALPEEVKEKLKVMKDEASRKPRFLRVRRTGLLQICRPLQSISFATKAAEV